MHRTVELKNLEASVKNVNLEWVKKMSEYMQKKVEY